MTDAADSVDRQSAPDDLGADLSTSGRLRKLVADAPGERVTLGWILEQIQERAFGLFLLVLALPCCVPFLYGVPQVVALPMLAVSAQLAAGRRAPWLPEGLRRREIAVSSLEALLKRAGPWLAAVEKFARPRLGALTRRPLDRVAGALLVLFSCSILLPLPSTNTVPGIAVAIASIGLLERDGLLVAGGAVLGTAWIGALVAASAWVANLLLGG